MAPGVGSRRLELDQEAQGGVVFEHRKSAEVLPLVGIERRLVMIAEQLIPRFAPQLPGEPRGWHRADLRIQRDHASPPAP